MYIETSEHIDILLFSIIFSTENFEMLLEEIIPYINFRYSPETIKYKKMLQEFKLIYGNPLCSNTCRLKTNVGYIHKPILVRQAHGICTKCNENVSENHHRVCYHHATLNEYPLEFEYHHYPCSVRRIVAGKEERKVLFYINNFDYLLS